MVEKIISESEIKKLIKQGYTQEKIAENLGIHYNTLLRKRKNMNFIIRKKITSYPNLNPSSHLSYILGALLGDGNVQICKVRIKKWNVFIRQIRLAVKDEKFADSFQSSLKSIGLHSSKNLYGKLYHIGAYNKEFVLWYKKLSFGNIEKLIIGYEKDFIRGFYESEGSYYNANGKKYVAIQGTKKDLMLFISKIINKLGIYHKFNRIKVGKTSFSYGIREFYYQIHIRKGGNPKKLIEMIKPCIRNA